MKCTTLRYGSKLYLGILFLFGIATTLNCGIHIQPANRVSVENRLDQPLVIYARVILEGNIGTTVNWGQVDPGTKRFVFGMGPPSEGERYELEARTLTGDVVWQRQYTVEQIVGMGYVLIIDRIDKDEKNYGPPL